MIKRTIRILGVLFLLSGCTNTLGLIGSQSVSGNRNTAVSAAQQDFIYHKIVHNWRKTTNNATFPLPYSAQVELVYSPDGRLRFSHFEKLSGNSQFDKELDQAIMMTRDLGIEISGPLEMTLTFHHAEMVRQHHRSHY